MIVFHIISNEEYQQMKKQERQRNRKIGCILCIIAIIFFVILSISNGLVNKSIYNIIFYILEPLVPVAF